LPRSSPSYSPAPTLRVVPRRAKDWSLGELAVTLAASYGLKADDWQADPVCCIFARRKNGRWASATTKISVPRQNGKNGILEIVELFGMVVLGMKFLHTAHEVKTARKAFRRIAVVLRERAAVPRAGCAGQVEIRKTNGQEAIFLSNGGSIEFIARSSARVVGSRSTRWCATRTRTSPTRSWRRCCRRSRPHRLGTRW
jgi:phage terminase large subunit-like protein